MNKSDKSNQNNIMAEKPPTDLPNNFIEFFDSKQMPFKRWLLKFETALRTYNCTEDTEKLEYLLKYMGIRAYDKICDKLDPDLPDPQNYNEVKKILEDYYGDEHNLEILEYHKFHSHNQQEGETVEQFSIRLRNTAERCNFGEFLGKALRNQFVCGLQDELTKHRLMKTTDLTIDKAIEIATKRELSRKETIQISNKSAVELKIADVFCGVRSNSNAGKIVVAIPSAVSTLFNSFQQLYTNNEGEYYCPYGENLSLPDYLSLLCRFGTPWLDIYESYLSAPDANIIDLPFKKIKLPYQRAHHNRIQIDFIIMFAYFCSFKNITNQEHMDALWNKRTKVFSEMFISADIPEINKYMYMKTRDLFSGVPLLRKAIFMLFLKIAPENRVVYHFVDLLKYADMRALYLSANFLRSPEKTKAHIDADVIQEGRMFLDVLKKKEKDPLFPYEKILHPLDHDFSASQYVNLTAAALAFSRENSKQFEFLKFDGPVERYAKLVKIPIASVNPPVSEEFYEFLKQLGIDIDALRKETAENN